MRQMVIGLLMDCEAQTRGEKKTPYEGVQKYVGMMHAPQISWRDLAAGDDDLTESDFECNSSTMSVVEHNNDDVDGSVVPPLQIASIPTLKELASMETLSAKFQNDSKSNEQAHKSLLAELLKSTESKVKQVFACLAAQLRETPEASASVFIIFLQSHVEQNMEARFNQHRDDATSRTNKIIENAKLERAKIRAEWGSFREDILGGDTSCF
jgi:hypothetical protein